MHLRWAESGNLGTNAIVGGGVPMAAGAAWAHRRAGEGDVVYTYFGDGATNIGSVLETMNLAAAWKLPICFFIENNRYAVSTHVEEVTAEPRLSSRGLAFGIPSFKVDGMDPIAVWLASEEANAIMRAGNGPTIIEADVYRYFHQNGPLPGSAFGYRSKDEEAEWRGRDPLDALAKTLLERQALGEDAIKALRERCVSLMDEVAGQLIEMRDGKRRIIPSLWPEESFRDFGLRGDLSEFDGVRFEEQESFSGKLVEDARFIDTVADVMARRMETDERVVVLGEDVHRLKGGTNGATRGLSADYPDRVLGTPISENAFTGIAGGMAADGRVLPVIEIHVSGFHVGGCGSGVQPDRQGAPHVRRRQRHAGGAAHQGCHGHGLRLAALHGPGRHFRSRPGWRIVAPSTPFDYVGLMNSALLCRDRFWCWNTSISTHRRALPGRRFRLFHPARQGQGRSPRLQGNGADLSRHGRKNAGRRGGAWCRCGNRSICARSTVQVSIGKPSKPRSARPAMS
ncbi:thiamine pyrophosphate-dependent enzyme [Brucella abortus]|nr:thiamine pyrophosphate-dependent enzyme [Brucella abortus]